MLRAFETLAQFPNVGTDLGTVHNGVRRFTHDSHVIYFRRTRYGILILRILGGDQDPAGHF